MTTSAIAEPCAERARARSLEVALEVARVAAHPDDHEGDHPDRDQRRRPSRAAPARRCGRFSADDLAARRRRRRRARPRARRRATSTAARRAGPAGARKAATMPTISAASRPSRRPMTKVGSICGQGKASLRSNASATLLGAAVLQAHDRRAAAGDRRVVRDQHDRAGRLRSSQQGDDLLARRRVEVAGRLVGEQHVAAVGERARDRDTLLLAARELRGQVAPRSPSPTLPSSSATRRAARAVFMPRRRERGLDVLLRGQRRDQVELLEDEADRRRRSSVRSPSRRRARSRPSKRSSPGVGRSSAPSSCSSVVLPEPGGPGDATNSPRSMRRSTRRRALSVVSPLP